MSPDPHAHAGVVALHNAVLLKKLRREPSSTFALLKESTSEVVALVRGDLGWLSASSGAADLAHILAQDRLRATRRPFQEVPAQGRFSFARARWNFGVRYGLTHGLGPWMEAQARFQMLDWPDFRLLGDFELALLVCRALSGPPLALGELVQRTGEPLQAICAALNGISLCGELRQDAGVLRRK